MITVIICTYNRSDILKESLDSLTPQKQGISEEEYVVLIIDNYSSDKTAQLAEQFTTDYANFKYIFDEQIGLSHARNTGYKNSHTDWVVYMDDDALASEDFVKRCLFVIDNYDFSLFGGVDYPWYPNGKPKWLSDEFGRKSCNSDDVGEVAEEGSVWGCNMAVKKSLLEKIGGFPENLGMNGIKVAYGEDNYLEMRTRQLGYSVGLDPKWTILHLVADHKLNPLWHIRMSFAQGRDRVKLYGTKDYRVSNLVLVFLRLLYHIIADVSRSLWRLLSIKNYYWENALIDSVRDVVRIAGEYVGYRQNNKTIKLI